MSSNQLAYICDRIQKITEAVYRVTELLSDREPMKWEIREKSVSIFTTLISLKNGHILEKNSKLGKIEGLIDQVIALLCLFSESKTISSVNFDILKEEYGLVRDLVSKQRQSQDFIKLSLEDVDIKKIDRPAQQKKENVFNGQSNGQIESENHDIGQVNNSRKEEVVAEQRVTDKTNSNKQSNNNKNKSLERKNRILGIIKEKKEVSIGELSVMFNECSEKTIQRDLLEMVGNGVLKKEGHKRWRKYMLVDKI